MVIKIGNTLKILETGQEYTFSKDWDVPTTAEQLERIREMDKRNVRKTVVPDHKPWEGFTLDDRVPHEPVTEEELEQAIEILKRVKYEYIRNTGDKET